MRKIKFRAWDKNRKKMFGRVTQIMFGTPHNLVQVVDGITAVENTTDVILMQYTGLEDKNGKEIYEGDIVDWDGNNSKHEICWNDKNTPHWSGMPDSRIGGSNQRACEVIGNIYSTPNLLK